MTVVAWSSGNSEPLSNPTAWPDELDSIVLIGSDSARIVYS